MNKAITIIQNPEPIGNPGGSIYAPGYSAVSIPGNQYSRLEKFEEEDSAIPPSRDLVNFRIDRRKGNGGIL